MNTLEKKFSEMGARIKIRKLENTRFRGISSGAPFSLDVGRDKKGEFFDVIVREDELEFQVVDLRKKDRHLLLAAIQPTDVGGKNDVQKFLCGHDERHWFVAGVGNTLANVDQAKQNLKPDEVVVSQRNKKVKHKNRHKRNNKGFIRQGEWFFIPSDNLSVNSNMILNKEPLQRGRGKPHMAEELYRTGGETVHVHSSHAPNGIVPTEFGKLSDKIKKHAGWRIMSRNPEAYVRGKIRHPDHKTVNLKLWHRVVPNNETGSRSVAFLD